MYSTYNIHVITHNLEFLQVFNSRQDAIEHLKKDAESHLSKFMGNVRWITKKKDMSGQPDGYYLRLSQKHANRVCGYEKRSIVNKGYLYNSTVKVITKIYVYSVTELPHEPLTHNFFPMLRPLRNVAGLTLPLAGQVGMNNKVGITGLTNIAGISGMPNTNQINDNSIDKHINELKACLKNRRAAMGLKQ